MATASTVAAASISAIITNGVTTGVSVGVAVGIVSGLFYLTCAGLRWAGRLRGAAEGGEAEEEEEEEADRKALALARERRLNARACVRCRQAFPRSSAIFRCVRCKFRICEDCCVQSQPAAPGDCLCDSCHREVQLKSGDWFYSQLRKRFGNFGLQQEEGSFLRHNTSKDLAEEVDAETGKVREFVERLVEVLVSGGLDNVNINRLYSHPEYDCMFNKYHSRLCEALSRLTISLQMSMSHHPLPTDLVKIKNAGNDGVAAMVGEEDDDGLLCSPSVAHAQLKTLVQQVINEARVLPRLGVQQLLSNGMHKRQADLGDVEMENNAVNGKEFEAENEDFASKTYEDILATAILNKVILQCQKENEWGPLKEGAGVDRNRNLLVDKVEVGVQAEVAEGCRMRGDGSGPEGASAEEFEEEDVEDNDNANFNSFGRWRNQARPFAYRIEEKVEEVMTTYTSDEENLTGIKHRQGDLRVERERTLSSGSSIDEDTSLSMMRGLALHHKSAPFPEFGVDIIDDDDDGDNEGSADEVFGEECSGRNLTTVKSGVDSWEENWLFQKRRLKMRGTLSKGSYPLVPMLVPNPSEDMRARIGDRDADDISDLSECNDSTEWDVQDFSRSHHLSTSSASIASDSLSSEPDPLASEQTSSFNFSCPIEATNQGLLDFAEAQNHQKDSEYTEDYAVAEQRILAMTPSPIPLEIREDLGASSIDVVTPKPVPLPRTHLPTSSRVSSHPFKYIPIPDRRHPPPPTKMEVVHAPESAIVYAGKAAHFTLDLWSRFPVEVWWFHEELLLEEDDNHRIFVSPSKSDRSSAAAYHLEVYNTDPQNSSGSYSVAAIDSSGNSIWHDFSLSVRGSRRADFSPEFVVEPTDVTVAQGGEVEFLIEVKGHPEPKVSFWKGASLLHSSSNGYFIERQGGGHWMLHIKNIAPVDGGKFVVEARNRVGVATATAEVQVVEMEPVSPPEEPLIPEVEEEMRALSSLEESSSVLQNGLQSQAEELRVTARRLSELVSQLEDLEIHLHSMEAEFGSLHSDLELGGIDMTTYVTSPWSTPLSSVSSSPPSSFSTSSSQAISALEDSSLQQRKVHLQQMLSCLQKEVEEAEGSREDLSECSPKSEVETVEKEASPPKPGTIAEREHRKWESAPPIPDNPYSPEKISERLRNLKLRRNAAAGRSRGSGSDTSIDFPEFHSESETSEMAIPTLTINCGGKDLNPKKYGRDYYINSSGESKRRVMQYSDEREKRKLPESPLSSIDKKEEELEGVKKVAEVKVTTIEKEKSKAEDQMKNDEPIQSFQSSFDEEHQQANEANLAIECFSETPIEIKDEKNKLNGNIIINESQTTLCPPDTKILANGTVNGISIPGETNGDLTKNSQLTFNKVSTWNQNRQTKEYKKESIVNPQTSGLTPSLPSVRQLALQFSSTARPGVVSKPPIIRRKKVQKEVVIVKKVDGNESKVDSPKQVDEDGIFRAELALSIYPTDDLDLESHHGDGHLSLAHLTLHAATESYLPAMHDLIPATLQSPDTHPRVEGTDFSVYQTTVSKDCNNTLLPPSTLGFALATNSSNISHITTANQATMFETDKISNLTNPSKKVNRKLVAPSFGTKGDFISDDQSNFDEVDFSKSFLAHSEREINTILFSAEPIPISLSQASDTLHKPNLSNSSNPENINLLSETGGDCKTQAEQQGGDKLILDPSPNFPLVEREVGSYQTANDSKNFSNSSNTQIVNELQDNEQVLKWLLNKDDEKSKYIVAALYSAKKSADVNDKCQEITLIATEAASEIKNDAQHLKSNSSIMGNNKDDATRNHYRKSDQVSSKDTDETDSKAKNEKKKEVNRELRRVHLQALLGARSASGKPVDSRRGDKKTYRVHSLTARSISREFREGLRQNQQTPLGKPVANTNEQMPSWKEKPDKNDMEGNMQEHLPLPLNVVSKHCKPPRSLDGNISDDYSDVTNGMHSREESPSINSLIDEIDGPLIRGVGGGIAFWERKSPLGAPANGYQKDS